MYEIEITPEGLRHLNRFTDKVRQSALKSIFEHPDYVATLDEYEACMAQLGYQTSDPSMTLNLTWSISFGDESAEALAEARQYEVAMATADWACQGATTLPVQLQLEHDLVAEVIAQFPEYAQP